MFAWGNPRQAQARGTGSLRGQAFSGVFEGGELTRNYAQCSMANLRFFGALAGKGFLDIGKLERKEVPKAKKS
jgi:hypothetical protein